MNLADRDGFIWQDGKLIDWRDAKIHVLTHTLHYSMGVFEGVRAYETPKGTAIFRLQDHTKRLLNSAKIYQMKVPYDQATLEQAQIDVVRENKLASCYLRPLIWIGSEKLGIAATNNTIMPLLLHGRGVHTLVMKRWLKVFALKLHHLLTIIQT